MKLGFWMLGMPNWSNPEIAQKAAHYGFHGVDLRCVSTDTGRRATMPQNIAFDASDAEISETREAFAEAQVEISSLLVYNRSPVSGPKSVYADFEDDITRHAELATKLGTSTIRFMLDGPPDLTTWEDYLPRVWERVIGALDRVPGVTALLENHIQRAGSEQILTVAQQFGDRRIGLDFSPEHSMVMQEDILDLVEHYTPWIHKVCWADRSVVQPDLGRFDGQYYYVRYQACIPGEGIVPAEKFISGLVRNGFDGYISLKWEKSSWFGDHLPDADWALGFFPDYIRQYAEFEPIPARVA